MVAAFLLGSTSPTIANNTIAANIAHYGGGIHCYYLSLPTIINTIVAFNSSGILGDGLGPDTSRYNCVYGNAPTTTAGLADPTGTDGNISVDPDWLTHPMETCTSSRTRRAEDAGDDSAVPAGWLASMGRPGYQGTHVDIGADESDGTDGPQDRSTVVRVRPTGSDANDGSSWALGQTNRSGRARCGLCPGRSGLGPGPGHLP